MEDSSKHQYSKTVSAVMAVAKFILPSRMYARRLKSWHKRRGDKFYEPMEFVDWKACLNDPRMDSVLKQMLLAYEKSPPEVMPSKYWIALNKKNVAQLLDTGFENFKQTIALNYFTWLVDEDNLQVKFLKNNLSPEIVDCARKKAKASKKHSLFTARKSRLYNFMTFMLWKYAEQQVGKQILDKLEEPLLGNPPAMELENRSISQDLANSALEFQSLSEGTGDFDNIETVLELGAGSGRTAYVLLCLKPHIRYIIVDIPPALYVSERYLSEVFPERKIFRFREFSDFSEIQDEFYSSEIIFLMPGQMKYLPDKSVDLFLAIDCLHEMRLEQIDFYFNVVDRLAKRFYFTCFKSTPIPYEDVTIEEKDYPVRAHWQRVFWRIRRVQNNFFEGLVLNDSSKER